MELFLLVPPTNLDSYSPTYSNLVDSLPFSTQPRFIKQTVHVTEPIGVAYATNQSTLAGFKWHLIMKEGYGVDDK